MLTQAIAGIWFAGSHQPWIVSQPPTTTLPTTHQPTNRLIQNLHFVFLELCSRPTYADLIRREIAAQPSLDVATLSQLPLLDSFIKECLRLNPLDESKTPLLFPPFCRPYSFQN